MIDALLQFWQQIQARPDFVPFMCIPLVASIVTWLHVWMALKMVFYPIAFWGVHVAGLPVGWQGIVPRKAGKISGILVDQSISKIGSLERCGKTYHSELSVVFISMCGNKCLRLWMVWSQN